MYKSLVRPFLFNFSPEKVQKLSHWAFKKNFLWKSLEGYFDIQDERLNIDLGGIRLKNPVGLAAGFDKDCDLLEGMSCLGFGYLTPGAIMKTEREGNPFPIYLRLPESCSFMNCAGLPSRGLPHSVRNLEARRATVPIIANIAGFSIEDYLECYHKLEPLVDGLELGLGCPNVGGKEPVDEGLLLKEISRIKKKPLFVKLPYRYRGREKELGLKLFRLCREYGVDGLTVSGARPQVPEQRLSMKAGTLSGKAVFQDTLRNVQEVYQATGGSLPIKASGGIFTGSDAFEVIKAGATAVELLTGFIYEGWGMVKKINRELLQLLEQHQLKSIADARGLAATT